MNVINITEDSKKLFAALAADAGNWGGMPIFGGNGNVSSDAASRGNLTQLKRAGLLTTFVDDHRDTVVEFTDEGIAYGASLGFRLHR